MYLHYRQPLSGLIGTFAVESSSTVGQLRTHIAEADGVSAEQIHLTLAGRPLFEGEELSQIVESEVEVVATFDLEGGAKGKKKKKQYTTPKHVAHKRKKVKLAVLKYYRIDNDKIDKIRMTCVNKTCGRGVFMAAHHNRTHCGKCGITLLKADN